MMNGVMNRPFLVLTVLGLFLGTIFVANSALASEDVRMQAESIVERYFSSLQNEDFDAASNLIKDKRFSSKTEQMEFYKEVSENDQILAYKIIEVKSLDEFDFKVTVEVVSSLAGTYTIDLSISKNDSGEWILADFTPLLIGGQEPVQEYVGIADETIDIDLNAIKIIPYSFHIGCCNYSPNYSSSFNVESNYVVILGNQETSSGTGGAVTYTVVKRGIFSDTEYGTPKIVTGSGVVNTNLGEDIPNSSGYQVRFTGFGQELTGEGDIYH